MIDLKNTTLICPDNDLESNTILEIADELRKLGLDVRRSKQRWGASLGEELKSCPKNLENLKDTVVIVEMPDKEIEKKLSQEVKNVILIDHHKYSFEDRNNPKSSLEQFAELFNHPLTDEEKLIALNDRGAYFALARESNCSIEDIERIRRKDFLCQDYDEDLFRQLDADFQNGVHFKKPPLQKELQLSLVTTQEKKNSYLAHLCQKPTRKELEEYRKTGKEEDFPVRSILILTLNDKDQVEEVHFYGPWKYKLRFETLFEDYGFKSYDYEFWQGGYPGHSFFWGSKRKIDIGTCDDLADAILNSIIGYHRPLLKFSTVFLYPFKFDGEANVSKEWEVCHFDPTRQDQYQEYIYFHAYVRDVLLKTKDIEPDQTPPIKYYEYTPICKNKEEGIFELEYEVRDKGASIAKKISYPLTHLAIHEFFNNIAILAIQVTKEVSVKIEFPFWKVCRDQIDIFRENFLTCQDSLLFNSIGRIVYVSYREQLKEGDVSKIPLKVSIGFEEKPPLEHFFCGDQFKLGSKDSPVLNNVVQTLVAEFLGKENEFHGILDDRMVVFTFMAFAGEKPKGKDSIGEYDALFSRIMYVDQIGDDYVYDQDFIKQQSSALIYRRWANLGNLYGFTRFSSVYTGFSPYFIKEIFNHFNTMYYQLAMISLYYRSSLIVFSKEVALSTLKLKQKNPDRRSFLGLKRKFMKFSNIYWFEEVTNQDQGIELFEIYQKSFQFKTMYEQIKGEIDRADEFLNILYQKRITEFSTNVAIGGVAIGLITILTGYFGMNFNEVMLNLGIVSEKWFWSVTFIGGGLVLGGVLFALILFIRNRWKED